MTIEATLERIAVALEKIATTPAVLAVKEDSGPKASKAKKSAPAAEAIPSSTASAAQTDAKPATEAAASTAASSSDDLFGDESAPEPKKENTQKPKEEKVKPLTIDDARNKVVALQTHLKSKAAAQAILSKFTEDGKPTLGTLKNIEGLIAYANLELAKPAPKAA